MNIVYGFGGMNSDGDMLDINPIIPAGWNKYNFTLQVGKAVVKVQVEQNKTTIVSKNGESVVLRLYGQEVTVGAEPYVHSKEA